MSETPLTDAQEDHCHENADVLDPFYVMTDHARFLERELAEARRLAEVYRGVWDRVSQAVDSAPNSDPLPWCETGNQTNEIP